MSVFVEKLNNITGKTDWEIENEDFDYHQEVARSSFADMLHDGDRNIKYEQALKSAINLMHKKGKKANVLDIGTGTGLLSLMAVRHGADSVVACEGFKPMGECALKVIERNGCKDKIKIIPKRSTEITVGTTGCDLERRCNILVTEVFDTELIGEGALSTFKHAHQVLLEKDCFVVPHSATIYAQVVESEFVQSWNKLRDIYNRNGELLLEIPENVKNCTGSAAVHDIQLSQITPDLVKTIISPLSVLHLDLSGKTPFIFKQSTISTVIAANNGTAQAVFMWWDLKMDPENKIVLSCAPTWAPPYAQETDLHNIPWRDHWMQAIYYLQKEVKVTKGQELHLICCHDEYSFWFNLKTNLNISNADYLSPICECAVHVAYHRTRIGQMNNRSRNLKLLEVLEKVTPGKVCLVLSEGSIVSLTAAKSAKAIYVVENNPLSRRILMDFIKFNKFDYVQVFQSLQELCDCPVLKPIEVVFGEPFFISGILPSDNVRFLYYIKRVEHLLSGDCYIFPQFMKIKALPMHFADLNKIRLPLGKCEGFDMKDFDELIEISSKISDDNVEAQPLWEYPGKSLGPEVTLLSLKCSIPESKESEGVFTVNNCFGNCNGIAFWVEWSDLESQTILSCGPRSVPTKIGDLVDWDFYTRQGVCLFPETSSQEIKYKIKLDSNVGSINFHCE